MPVFGLSPAVAAFLALPNFAVMACVRPDGFPLTVVTWYEWANNQVLVNMQRSRTRLMWISSNPRVGMTIVDSNWYRHVSLYGHVSAVSDDIGLVDIDRIARRYTGERHRTRDKERVSVSIAPDGWHIWDRTGELRPAGP